MIAMPWTRKGRIAVNGSPVFDFDSPALAASEVWNLGLEEDSRNIYAYLPLDFIEVINDSVKDLTLTLNGVLVYRVSANSTRSVQRRSFRQVQIANSAGAATVAADIHVTVERLPADADSEARRRASESVR